MTKKWIKRILGNQPPSLNKYESETDFWKAELGNYIKWFNGEIKEMYATEAPSSSEKILTNQLSHSAILTWHKKHQEKKYLRDLNLGEDAFQGKRLLDIGSGPMPSATCFRGTELYCLDPLLDKYLGLGFPIHYFNHVNYIHGPSEHIFMPDGFFDAVISVNALDHVDDFEKTAVEIQRVLRKSGTLVFHIHCHPPTQNEPLELNDQRIGRAFSDIENFRKVSESHQKMGYTCHDNETYSVWTNLP